ncbi:MAG: outer membrane protein assembly factor BamD [Nitrospirota bacterium]
MTRLLGCAARMMESLSCSGVVVRRTMVVLGLAVVLAACAGKKDDPALKPLLTLTDLQYDAGVIMTKAEGLYDEKKWDEAIPEYERFLELHPVHRWAPHAQFKLALCYMERIPEVGRDPSIAEKAEAAFERVLSYSDTRYADVSRVKLAEVRGHRAQANFETGRFYYKQKKYPAAIARFQQVIDAKLGGTVTEEATYFLALAYERDGQMEQAGKTAQALMEEFPTTRHAKAVAKLQARVTSSAN